MGLGFYPIFHILSAPPRSVKVSCGPCVLFSICRYPVSPVGGVSAFLQVVFVTGPFHFQINTLVFSRLFHHVAESVNVCGRKASFASCFSSTAMCRAPLLPPKPTLLLYITVSRDVFEKTWEQLRSKNQGQSGVCLDTLLYF